VTEGSCLCGAVRFAVEAFGSGVFKCHCSKCRKAFGGASSAAALANDNNFTWLRGGEGVREFRCESGFTRRFCPACGSILPQYIADRGMYWVPVGLLDSDPGLRLRHHIHLDSKAPWELLDGEARRHAGGFDT
jgi:hypothetical protein